MIFSPHMAMGAVIGAKFNNPWLAAVLCVGSHYILDVVPHIEYSIKDIKSGKINRGFLKDFLKVIADFLIGLGLGIYIWTASGANIYNILLAMFFSILPDIFTFIFCFYKSNFLLKLSRLHHFLHFFSYKKIPNWARVFTQVLVIIWGVWLFK